MKSKCQTSGCSMPKSEEEGVMSEQERQQEPGTEGGEPIAPVTEEPGLQTDNSEGNATDAQPQGEQQPADDAA